MFQHRTFGNNPSCDEVVKGSKAHGATGQIIGHTPVGIRDYCDGKLWQVDALMSNAFGPSPRTLQVLVIYNDNKVKKLSKLQR